ncbi:MAG: hypothetical protein K2X47_00550 [Bdellovibrionales bacterium]|nr:hypothetical protein [Bdellovibrionales bacterium]
MRAFNFRKITLCIMFSFLSGPVIAYGMHCSTDPLPTTLSATCLFKNNSLEVRQDVRGFLPEFPLWSDGATKQRFIALPEGQKIDTSDMEQWVFPKGTKLWKEFRRGAMRVETRLLVKVLDEAGPQAWHIGTYAWRSDQTDADLVTEGVTDALGTGHTIPKVKSCLQCHGGAKDIVLGFEALQLSHKEEDESKIDLDWLSKNNFLSHAPTQEFQLPGSPLDQAALGYLHANCGSCHNPRGLFPYLDLKHSLAAQTLTDQKAYKTLTKMRLIVLGAPEKSRLVRVMSQRPGMPKVASDIIDEEGVDLIRRWIQDLK